MADLTPKQKESRSRVENPEGIETYHLQQHRG